VVLCGKAVTEEQDNRPPYYYFYEHYSLSKSFPFYFNPRWVFDDNPIQMMHSHNVLEVGYCHHGSGIFAVGSKLLPYSKGDVSFVTPKEVHFARSLDENGSTWSFMFLDMADVIGTHFSDWWTFDVNMYSGSSFENIFSQDRHPLICSIVHSIVEEAIDAKDYHEDSIRGLLIQLAVQLRRMKVAKQRREVEFQHQSIERLRPAIEYIGINFRNKIDIEELATLCFMSYRNFDRLFHSTFQRSPLDYIIELRLATICNELKNTDEPITSIALRNGFFSISSFNRKFKERTGMTPRDWRQAE
jgi:AraC-like DNA-binding protein